jgi:RNA polymerase sigma-70 factor (ECF subfamily)
LGIREQDLALARRLGSRTDRAAAEEICQQALIRGLARIGSYRGEAALFTWFCTIARNGLADWWTSRRAEGRHVAFIEDDDSLRAAVESIEAPSGERPDRRRAQAELGRLIQVALDQLPSHYGAILEMKYLDGLPVDEIAKRVNQPFMAAQSLLARARAAFRTTFAAQVGPELAELLTDTAADGRRDGAP